MNRIRSPLTYATLWLILAAVLLLAPSTSLGRGVFGAQLSQAEKVGCCVAGTSEGSRWMGVAVRYLDTGAAHGNAAAPRDGQIGKVKLIAAIPGDLILYLARAKNVSPVGLSSKARITRRVARFRYEGQPEDRPPYHLPFRVETVNVRDTKVKKGEYLAVETVGPGMDVLTCPRRFSGKLLFYQPPLDPGQSFMPYAGEQGCSLLIKAVMK